MHTMSAKLTELYKKQISLTEWFEATGHPLASQLRSEDNEKRERLKILHAIIGLPFDAPTKFALTDILEPSNAFANYLQQHGDELCALRLIPTEESLPKLRMRGHTVRDVVSTWLPEQHVEPAKYRAEFIPHPERNEWATIFVVNNHGIFGEVVAGAHSELTQGFYDHKPTTFAFDFNSWQTFPENNAVITHMQSVIERIRVTDEHQRQEITDKLKATFHNNYLAGYFETTHSEFGTWFIDYNQLLGTFYEDFHVTIPAEGFLRGSVGAPGVAHGTVRIVHDPAGMELSSDDILVCDMTSPDYIHCMQQAAAIVTDRGGMLCHAAIVARELKKPCVVGTGNATHVLQDGMQIEVNANDGTIRPL